jgi:alpha-tubulin suppressor-like RCC1 family protein
MDICFWSVTCTVTQIDAGWGHSLAVCSDGSAWGWGYNVYGQVGYYPGMDWATPIPVQKPNPLYPDEQAISVDLTGAVLIDAGDQHSLAVTEDGAAWAWGQNTYGQLGITQTYNVVAKLIGNLTGVTVVVGGYRHSLALLADGTVRACGSNASGQLGDGTTTDRTTPVKVLIP